MPYKVKLESFEGPLDLLLFLIKKNEVDIYDIPVSTITAQYLEYIEIIKLLDIEAASDFILMAATLMRIKAQMLLPRPEVDEMDEIEDPRQELVYRLLEYKRFKDVAEELGEKEKQAAEVYPRGSFKYERNGFDEEILQSSDVSLFDLVAAFKKIVETREKVTIHRVREISVTLEERITFLRNEISTKKKIEFQDLFNKDDDKTVWIVTFIALLELIKQKVIQATQSESFGKIIIEEHNG